MLPGKPVMLDTAQGMQAHFQVDLGGGHLV
jgi:hypothetical protein